MTPTLPSCRRAALPAFDLPGKRSASTLCYLSLLLLGLSFWLPNPARADPGDTTWVRAHDARDMVWNEAYDHTAALPSGSWGRVLAYFTLGCASGGCSDWDYTVLISRVDTVTGQEWELGRCITPYGGYMRTGQRGFNNNWTRTFVYDVTDLASVLQGRQRLRLYYDGWSSGFSGTLDLAFIEGLPPRDVLSMEVLYHSGPSDWVYSDAASFDASYLGPRTVTLPAGAQHARLRVIPSGHGFDNNVFCAEFCERSYRVSIDGSERFVQPMWRDDCGENPVYPQAGTWLFDRANWCPGSEAWTWWHDWSTAAGASDMEVDIDLDSYTWSGPQAPSYIFHTQIITYGAFRYSLDAELSEILRPSEEYAYSRMNPICGRPAVRLANRGGQTLQSCTIAYGLVNGTTCYQAWTGELAHGESEVVELGNIDWSELEGSGYRFFARVEGPNGGQDEVSWNDQKTSVVQTVPLLDERFIVWMRTNARPEQNAWRIRNQAGEVVASRLSFTGPFQIHQDTVDLPEGCYHFELSDAAEDGLEFFANSDGTGTVRFLAIGGGALRAFDANFGTRIDLEFTTGLEQQQGSYPLDCGSTGTAPVPPVQERAKLRVYPNPAVERLYAEWPCDELPERCGEPAFWLLYGPDGQLVWSGSSESQRPDGLDLPVHELGSGLFVLEARRGAVTLRSRVALQNKR
jgi:hypothetical protein